MARVFPRGFPSVVRWLSCLPSEPGGQLGPLLRYAPRRCFSAAPLSSRARARFNYVRPALRIPSHKESALPTSVARRAKDKSRRGAHAPRNLHQKPFFRCPRVLRKRLVRDILYPGESLRRLRHRSRLRFIRRHCRFAMTTSKHCETGLFGWEEERETCTRTTRPACAPNAY
jgi:hypothetical protein